MFEAFKLCFLQPKQCLKPKNNVIEAFPLFEPGQAPAGRGRARLTFGPRGRRRGSAGRTAGGDPGVGFGAQLVEELELDDAVLEEAAPLGSEALLELQVAGVLS